MKITSPYGIRKRISSKRCNYTKSIHHTFKIHATLNILYLQTIIGKKRYWPRRLFHSPIRLSSFQSSSHVFNLKFPCHLRGRTDLRWRKCTIPICISARLLKSYYRVPKNGLHSGSNGPLKSAWPRVITRDISGLALADETASKSFQWKTPNTLETSVGPR